jgi:glycosyltransferase involved in cell wall biosynthesis
VKVAIFTDNDFSKVNGVTTALRSVLDHAPHDIEPRLYTCEGRDIERPGYTALRGIGMEIPFHSEMKVYAPPFRRFLRRAQADGIDLIHLTTPGPVGLAAMYVAARMRIRTVGSFHTDLAEYTRVLSGSDRLGRLMREYLRWPYGRCDQIFVPSDATRRTLIHGKIDAAKIRLWKRGVSTERFSPVRRSDALRHQWGISGGCLALLYVGRVSREKGLDLLAPLSARLTRARISHRYIIVGDGPMRSELQAACPGAVFTGTLVPEMVATAMASSDIFVFPSRTDTAGNVVLEAQASGLPVLVTDEGGPSENMIDGETGHVCGDQRAFARRLGELAWNPERRTMQSLAARRYAFERTWGAALAPLYHAYREIATTGVVSGDLVRPAIAR